jgi:hypothetical protein
VLATNLGQSYNTNETRSTQAKQILYDKLDNFVNPRKIALIIGGELGLFKWLEK